MAIVTTATTDMGFITGQIAIVIVHMLMGRVTIDTQVDATVVDDSF